MIKAKEKEVKRILKSWHGLKLKRDSRNPDTSVKMRRM